MSDLPRGIRNNNPGNIRHVVGTTWVGQCQQQTDESFVQFTDPAYGIRAIARILRSYYRQGVVTIGDMIDRWAPPNENNSQAYVDAVCKECQQPAETVVDLTMTLPSMVKAIIRHENGEMPYTDHQIQQGISLA